MRRTRCFIPCFRCSCAISTIVLAFTSSCVSCGGVLLPHSRRPCSPSVCAVRTGVLCADAALVSRSATAFIIFSCESLAITAHSLCCTADRGTLHRVQHTPGRISRVAGVAALVAATVLKILALGILVALKISIFAASAIRVISFHEVHHTSLIGASGCLALRLRCCVGVNCPRGCSPRCCCPRA